MTSPAHAPLSPSAAIIWRHCTGQPRMATQFPQREDSAASMEGTAAHWVAAEVMYGRRVLVDTIAPNGICVTDEMIEGAELYYESFTVPPQFIESAISCKIIHPQCYGTPDAYSVSDGCIYVTDYKFGHAYVDAFENWQGVAYLAGVLDMHPQFDDDTMRFSFTIVQPRCFSRAGSVRRWEGFVRDLKPLIEQLKMAAHLAMSDSAALVVGEHCTHYCSAIHSCPAAQREMGVGFHLSTAVLPSPMQPAEMAIILRRIEFARALLKSMADGVTEEAMALMRSGGTVPGFGMEAGRGKLAWSKPVEEVLALGDMFGVELAKDGAITPTQAAAKFKKIGIDTSVITEYSSHQSGALKLVQTDESVLRSVFSKGRI